MFMALDFQSWFIKFNVKPTFRIFLYYTFKLAITFMVFETELKLNVCADKAIVGYKINN